MTEPTTAIVNAEPSANGQAVREWMPFKGDDAFYCSLKAVSQDDKLRIFQLREGDHESLQENANLEIDLAHILAHQVSLEKPTGEVVEATRIVLLAADGRSYQCVSEGVRSSLETLLKLFGPPSQWSAPLKLKIATATTNGGRRIMKLVPVLPVTGSKKK